MKNKSNKPASPNNAIIMTRGQWFMFDAAAAAVGLIAVEGAKAALRFASKKMKEREDAKSSEKAPAKKKAG